MKLNIYSAARILNIKGETTPKITKLAYRRACSEFHPDRNPAGAQMMVQVNAAYEVLKDHTGFVGGADKQTQDSANDEGETVNSADYGADMMAALNSVIDLSGLTVEIAGDWIWLTGDTKSHKDIIKAAGFKWARKKVAWYFRPDDYKSKSKGGFSMDEIRDKHNAKVVRRAQSNSYPAA